MKHIFTSEQIDSTISFHGHSCPGLAIGIRAAEYGMKLLGKVGQENLVCVSETDMCAVDAIQYLCGCTYGKGNLIHRDIGKAAFTFYDRSGATGYRLVLKSVVQSATDDTKEKRIHSIMTAPLEELFSFQTIDNSPPRRARVLDSVTCEQCQEEIMESRMRRFAGQTLCLPCFEKVEQKI